jgi:hypothetical protein
MKSLEQLQTDRSTFSIGLAISDGWKLVSKTLGYYILGGVVTVIISIAAGIIPFVGGIASNIILSPCLMAGAIYVTWRISNGIPWTDFGDMFKGFKLMTPLAISTLIQFVVTLGLTMLFLLNYLHEIIELFNLALGPDAYQNQVEIEALVRGMVNTEFIVLFLVLMAAVLCISVIWAFKYHFIVIYKMQGWPAMEMSRKIAGRNFFPLLGFFIVMGIIIIISAIPCGIGLLFSLPLMIGATYSAFAQITDCDQDGEINKEMFDFMGEEKRE